MSSSLTIPLMFVGAAGALAFLALALMLFARFRLIDCLPLIVICSVVFFLSRFNHQFAVFLGMRKFPGMMFLMLLWLPVLYTLRSMRGIPSLPFANPILFMLTIFSGIGFLSGIMSSPNLIGIISPLHVICTTVLPLLLAFSMVATVGRDRKSHEHLVTSFILFCGVFLPGLMLIGALAPDSIGRYLGWGAAAERHGAGFSAARTPIGSGIASAMVANIAYGFALCRFLTKKQWLNFIPIALVGFALLFSLQRSALAMFLIFNALFFVHAARKHLFALTFAGILALGTFAAVSKFLPDHYRFDRFLSLGGDSADIRFSGIKGAWLASLHAPVFGHGPGLLYDEFRTTFALEKEQQSSVHDTITIYGYASPQEPHNTYAFVAAEFGFFGFISFVGLLIYLWRKTQAKSLKSLAPQDLLYRKMYNAQWVAYLAGMYTHSTPLANMKPAMFFWLFAAMGIHWYACCLVEHSAARATLNPTLGRYPVLGGPALNT